MSINLLWSEQIFLAHSMVWMKKIFINVKIWLFYKLIYLIKINCSHIFTREIIKNNLFELIKRLRDIYFFKRHFFFRTDSGQESTLDLIFINGWVRISGTNGKNKKFLKLKKLKSIWIFLLLLCRRSPLWSKFFF